MDSEIQNGAPERPSDASVQVHPLPTSNTHELCAGSLVIVVDLLRASTTIVHALAAGARSIRPVVTVDEARQLASSADPGQDLLGGERAGVPPEGFDLGNSPAEYVPDRVTGRRIIFTTSNGTRAIQAARHARIALVGALVNLKATAAFAARSGLPIHVLCAGTADRPSEDDLLCAGAFVEHLGALGVRLTGTDAADAARRWESAAGEQDALIRALEASVGGSNLLKIGLAKDIKDAARIDRKPIVARVDKATGEIVRA